MTENQKYNAFLQDLTELSRKHGVYVDGCGCCGSPSLDLVEIEGRYMTYEEALEKSYSEVTWVLV